MIRRPDVVIVNDPTRPPTQDNIKQVVEIKFPPDTVSREQRRAYADIAGSSDKVVVLGPEDCDCWSPKPKPTTIPAPDAKSLTVGSIMLMVISGLLAF
jgi:VRR-NUC domain